MKNIRKYWNLYRKYFTMTVVFQLFAFLVGMILVFIINKTVNKDTDYATMGTFLGLVMTFVLSVYRIDTSPMFLAVGMGQTRRSYLLWDTVFHAVQFLISILICRLLYFIETAVFTRLYPGFVNGMPLDVFFSLPVTGLITVTVAGAGLLFMMLKVRFGHKTFILVWLFCWMIFMLGARAVSDVRDGKAGLLAALGKGLSGLTSVLPGHAGIILGYCLAAALMVVGFLGLRRVEIRQ